MVKLEGQHPKGDGDTYFASDLKFLNNTSTKFTAINFLNLKSGNVLHFTPEYVDVDAFGTDTASETHNLVYDAGSDYYRTFNNWSTGSMYFAEIVASSYGGASSQVIKVGSNTWRYYYDDNSYEVNRAKVLGDLFYSGTISDFTTVSSIDVNDVTDAGKKFYLRVFSVTASGGGSDGSARGLELIDRFSSTVGNSGASYWSNLTNDQASTSITAEFPNSTSVNTVSNSTSNELGTDRSADEKLNPADTNIHYNATNNFSVVVTSVGRVLVGTTATLQEGSVAITGLDSFLSSGGTSFLDWTATSGIPLLGSVPNASLSNNAILISDAFIIDQTFTQTFIHPQLNVSSGTTVNVLSSHDNQTNYTNIGSSNWNTITNNGSTTFTKIELVRNDDSQFASINGYTSFYEK